MNCNQCRFSNEEDTCDRGHSQRMPGKAYFATTGDDFKSIVEREAQEITSSDVGKLEDIF